MPDDLEGRLTSLATALEWPATPPHLWGVRAEGVRRSRTEGPWSRWYLAAAAALVVVALLAYSPTREAIAAWINLHTIVQRVEHPPTPSPLPPGPLGKRLGLGSATTLVDAQAHVRWRIVVPASLGAPDEVYLQLPPDGPTGGEVTLVYAARPGIAASAATGVGVLVTEAQGAVNENYFGKMLGPGTTLENVTVNGHPGWWISGTPHDFFFVDASGNFRSETLRLATNTLIFDDGGTIVRVEGDLTKAQALQIAASLS